MEFSKYEALSEAVRQASEETRKLKDSFRDSSPLNPDNWNDYTIVDFCDNKYAVRWSPTMSTQVRTPSSSWEYPAYSTSNSVVIRKLAEALWESREECERLQDLYNKQHALVELLFGYLDWTEESDEGRVWHPIQISCARAMMLEPLSECLNKLRESVK